MDKKQVSKFLKFWIKRHFCGTKDNNESDEKPDRQQLWLRLYIYQQTPTPPLRGKVRRGLSKRALQGSDRDILMVLCFEVIMTNFG